VLFRSLWACLPLGDYWPLNDLEAAQLKEWNQGAAERAERATPCYVCGSVNHCALVCDRCRPRGGAERATEGRMSEGDAMATPCRVCGNADHYALACDRIAGEA